MKRRRGDNMLTRYRGMKFVIGLLLIAYSIGTYWLFWPYEPMIISEPIVIDNFDHTVHPGDYLRYDLHLDKQMDLPCVVYRQLLNNFTVNYSPVYSNIPVGKRVMSIKLLIPNSAEPGDYRLKVGWEYKVNPIRTILVEKWSEPFQVVAKVVKEVNCGDSNKVADNTKF